MNTNAETGTWLLSQLRRIRMRPGMYLGDNRLNSLACYVHGFIYGLAHAGVRDTIDERFLAAFGRWLGERLDKRTGDCWFYIERCLPDGSGHISDFFRELDRYLQESGYSGLDDEKLDLLTWNDQ